MHLRLLSRAAVVTLGAGLVLAPAHVAVAADAGGTGSGAASAAAAAFRPLVLTGPATFTPYQALRITGTATPDTFLVIRVSGAADHLTPFGTRVDASGAFSVQTPRPLGGMRVTVSITQSAGGAAVTRDYAPQQAAAFVPLALDARTTFTPNQTLTVSGTATPGALVRLRTNGGYLVPQDFTARADTTGAFTAQSPKRFGAQAVTVTVTQQAGNPQDSGDRAQQVIAPEVAAAHRPVTLTGAGTFTPNRPLTITGTGTPNTSLMVSIAGNAVSIAPFLAFTDASGGFSVETPKALGDRTVTVTVRGDEGDRVVRNYTPQQSAGTVSASTVSALASAEH